MTSPPPDKIRKLEKEAADGDPTAQWHLARLLLKDEKRLEEAAMLMLMAAESGLSEAQRDLGQMFLDGRGVPIDPEKAKKWLKAASGKEAPESTGQRNPAKRKTKLDRMQPSQDAKRELMPVSIQSSKFGRIKKVYSKKGDKVAIGQSLLCIEEPCLFSDLKTWIRAPFDCTIKAIKARFGEPIKKGKALVVVSRNDKILSVMAPRAGIVSSTENEVGSFIQKGTVILWLDTKSQGRWKIKSSADGILKSIEVKENDRVSRGSMLATIELSESSVAIPAPFDGMAFRNSAHKKSVQVGEVLHKKAPIFEFTTTADSEIPAPQDGTVSTILRRGKIVAIGDILFSLTPDPKGISPSWPEELRTDPQKALLEAVRRFQTPALIPELTNKGISRAVEMFVCDGMGYWSPQKIPDSTKVLQKTLTNLSKEVPISEVLAMRDKLCERWIRHTSKPETDERGVVTTTETIENLELMKNGDYVSDVTTIVKTDHSQVIERCEQPSVLRGALLGSPIPQAVIGIASENEARWHHEALKMREKDRNPKRESKRREGRWIMDSRITLTFLNEDGIVRKPFKVEPLYALAIGNDLYRHDSIDP